MPSSADKTYQSAVQNFQSGNLLEAEKLCQQMLAADPDNAEVNHLLGVIIAHHGGKHDSAIHYLNKALSINPNNVKAHNNLGNVLQMSGQLEEAIASYREALQLKPDYAEAHNNLGLVFKGLGKPEEAIFSYRQALFIKPDYTEAHINLGDILRDSDRLEDAFASYNKALSLQPNNAGTYNSIGLALQKLNRMDEAITSYKKALSLKPDYAEACNNLGNVFIDSDKPEEAIASYKKALSLKPDYAIAQNNLGVVLQESGRLDEAEYNFKQALTLKPDFAEAYSNLGIVYKEQCMVEEAIASYRKALALKPDFSFAHSNLLFVMNYSPNISQRDIFEESRDFAAIHAPGGNTSRHFRFQTDITKRKLRVGYVSPDFRRHSVAFFFEPLLKAHNRKSFEIYCYSDVKKPDKVTKRIQEKTDHWIPIVRKRDAEVIEMIKRDHIDILVELTGHTRNNRLSLLALKAAPIQVSWLGYANTTGLQEIDYRFTDAIADPVGKDDEYYSEQLIRLKDCFLCYQPYEHAPDVSSSPCLGNDTVTFGSFNFLTKVTPEVVKVWTEILVRVPDSRLVIKAKQLGDKSVKARYMQMFEEQGVSSDRIDMLGMVEEVADHLALYSRIDIALDPFPYNGTTTTCEALWMGVPVVTLLGNRHSGRVGASILHAVGMEELLVADSAGSYIEKAVSLAKNKRQLQNLRKNLRQQMQESSLCDVVSFAKKIEAAYEKMWLRYKENIQCETG